MMKNKKSVTTDLVDVSPRIAAEWLEGNVDNRKISKANVEKICEDIKLGKWRLTPDAIAFYADGALANGQHRLLAIAQSGATVRCVVMRNLSRDSNDAIDQGRKRSFADAARFLSTELDAADGSITRYLVMQYESEMAGKDVWPKEMISSGILIDWAVTLSDSVKFARTVKGKLVRPVGLLAAVACGHLVYGKTKLARLERFVDVLNGGDAAPKDKAARHVREIAIEFHGKRAGQAAIREMFLRTCYLLEKFMSEKLGAKGHIPEKCELEIKNHVNELLAAE